jgi:hypothetical protein
MLGSYIVYQVRNRVINRIAEGEVEFYGYFAGGELFGSKARLLR